LNRPLSKEIEIFVTDFCFETKKISIFFLFETISSNPQFTGIKYESKAAGIGANNSYIGVSGQPTHTWRIIPFC